MTRTESFTGMKLALAALAAVFGLTASAEPAVGAGHEYDNVKLNDGIRSGEKLQPALLTVNPERAVRKYDAAMFGLSYDFAAQDGIGMAKTVPGRSLPELVPEFRNAARGVPLPLNRLWFVKDNWKFASGPMESRKKHKRTSWEAPVLQVAGPVETIRSILEVDPSAQFVVTPTIVDDEAVSQAREIAEFLTGDASTEWGSRRIAWGLPEPVNVAIWELGNETDWSANKLTIAEYVRLCKATIAAIRSVQPEAKFAPHAATAPWHETQKEWKNWHRTLLAELAPDISLLAFHPYYHGYPVDVIERYMDVIRDDIAKSANPGIGIFISEHGLWPGGEPGPWEKSWYKTHALVGCLAVSEWFNRMLAHPEVKAMTMHAASSGPWGMFYPDGSGGVYATALADLFKLYKLVPYGGTVVESRLTGEGTQFDDKLSLSALAVRGEGTTLYVVVTNRLPDTGRTLTLDLGGRKLESVRTLTADSVKAVNSASTRQVTVSCRPASGEESRILTIPPRSVTLLEAK